MGIVWRLLLVQAPILVSSALSMMSLPLSMITPQTLCCWRRYYYTVLLLLQDDKRQTVLSWARNAVTTHDHVLLCLLATMEVSSSSSSSSPLAKLNGKSGLLELVAAYTGYPKVNDLRIVRQLLAILPTFIEDVPFVEEEDEGEDE